MRPFSINSVRCQLSSMPLTQPIRSPRPVNSYGRIGSNLIPARRSTSALNVSTPRAPACIWFWHFYDRFGYPSHAELSRRLRPPPAYAPAADSQTYSRCGRRFLLPCSMESPPPTNRLKPTSLPFSAIATKFMSLACRSISFCGGITTVVLNLRGR